MKFILFLTLTFFILSQDFENKFFGDFNGDGELELASIYIIDSMVFDQRSAKISIEFSDTSIKPLISHSNRNYLYLINEGDLNNDGKDDLSLFLPPNHGCTYGIESYSYNDGRDQIVDLFLIPTACNPFDQNFLDSLIIIKNSKIRYKDYDVNKSPFETSYKELKLKDANSTKTD